MAVLGWMILREGKPTSSRAYATKGVALRYVRKRNEYLAAHGLEPYRVVPAGEIDEDTLSAEKTAT